MPHSHGRVKGHRNTKDGAGKAQPNFPAATRAPGQIKPGLGAAWIDPERVRDGIPGGKHGQGQQGHQQGAAEHLHGVGGTRG